MQNLQRVTGSLVQSGAARIATVHMVELDKPLKQESLISLLKELGIESLGVIYSPGEARNHPRAELHVGFGEDLFDDQNELKFSAGSWFQAGTIFLLDVDEVVQSYETARLWVQDEFNVVQVAGSETQDLHLIA